MGGEPVGKLVWVYDGEKFVDGVYEVACADCKHVVFTADVCPRCNAARRPRARAGDAEPLARAVRVPVVRRRGAALRRLRPGARHLRRACAPTSRAPATELHEDGFHGYRADCRDCGTVAELTDACPLCEAPAPLRARPG